MTTWIIIGAVAFLWTGAMLLVGYAVGYRDGKIDAQSDNFFPGDY